MAESPLPGGGRTEVSRDGDIVYRGTGPWAPAVHALLRHLESVGFEGAPRVVGSGFDEKGREVLGYIDGDVVHPRPWGASAFAELGRLLRRLHEATSTFTLPDDAVWRRWHARAKTSPRSTRERNTSGSCLDGYGLAADRRSGFVDRMIEFAIRDAAAEAVEAGVTPATVESPAIWGIAWRVRSAAWMLNNRGVLQAALAS